MTDRGLLSALADQATREGASVVTVHALVEESAELGATRALARLGLDDAVAANDLREVRDLLAAWRDIKREALHSVIGWAIKVIIIAVVCTLMLKWRELPDVL